MLTQTIKLPLGFDAFLDQRDMQVSEPARQWQFPQNLLLRQSGHWPHKRDVVRLKDRTG